MRFSYWIRQTVSGTFQKWKGNLVMVVCLAISFLVLAAFVLITVNLRGIYQKLKGDVEIEVYLDDAISPQKIRSLESNIQGYPEVEKVTYKSKGSAFIQMENYLGREVITGLDSNMLPASFQVTLKKEHKKHQTISILAAKIQNQAGVEETEFGGEWLTRLDKALKVFLAADLIFGILVTLSTAMMVSNFMRASILSQAESIQVMNLLGASRKDIHLPFLFQGMILGGCGAALGLLLTGAGYAIFRMQFPSIVFFSYHLIPLLVLWGMVSGAAGSFGAVKKQLALTFP
jgi:cell division transport system permease protein